MAYNNNNNNKKFNLDQYETVKSRKVRLRNDHPNSFIMPFPLSDLNYAGNYVLMGSLIWRDKATIEKIDPTIFSSITEMASKANPQNAGIIMASIGIVAQADGVGHSLSMAGGSGADKNAWVENAEESAVGRALDNMGYHSGSASQEEIKKVEHMQQVQAERVQFENQINSMYGLLMSQGHNTQYLNQVVSQSVKPFTQLSELSIEELSKLLGALQEINGQGAYQAQQQYNQRQQAPPPPNAQVQGALAPVPGAPAPVGAR